MFLSKKQNFQEILFNLVGKFFFNFFLLKLTNCIYVTISFDLWMSKGAHDIFALVMNFLGFDWQPKQVINK